MSINVPVVLLLPHSTHNFILIKPSLKLTKDTEYKVKQLLQTSQEKRLMLQCVSHYATIRHIITIPDAQCNDTLIAVCKA